MVHYRFYVLNDQDLIDSASEREFESDSEACSAALAMLRDKPIEGWQSARIVFRAVPSAWKPQFA